MNNSKIEIQDKTEVDIDSGTQSGSDFLFDIAVTGARDAQQALDALLLAAANIAVHDHGSVAQNMEKARQRLAALLEYTKEQHAECIAEALLTGHQHSHEVH